MFSRSDLPSGRHGHGGCQPGLLECWEYSERTRIGGRICTADVEDKQAENEEEKAQSWGSGDHL